MSSPNPLKSSELEFKSLLMLVALASLLFALIIWPFFGAVCWAVFIAIVFWPLYQRFLKGSHHRPNMAAAATLTVVLLIVILPMSMVAAAVTQEASMFVERMRSGEIRIGAFFQGFIEALPQWAQSMLKRFGILDFAMLQQKLIAALSSSSQVLTSRVMSIGQVTLDFIVAFFVMLYIVFFLFRDGERLTKGIQRSIPLQPLHTERLMRQFATVVRATVKGNIVVALVQGALGGIAFGVLGIPGAVLWGAVMALFSLLPAVGAALVWAPVAIWFFFNGQMLQGIGLTVWGGLVIGLVDNVLRPILVGKDTRMPDYLVLVATLGGIVVFGLNGFVIGPVIAAMFLVSWEMLATVRANNDS